VFNSRRPSVANNGTIAMADRNHKVDVMALAIALRDVLDCIGAPDQWQAIRHARATLDQVTGNYATKVSSHRRMVAYEYYGR
jgi:hypothetical protein